MIFLARRYDVISGSTMIIVDWPDDIVVNYNFLNNLNVPILFLCEVNYIHLKLDASS